jgi:hypothetical protein
MKGEGRNPTLNIKLKGEIYVNVKIRKDIQEAVDKYIDIDAEYKKLGKQLKALRGEIEPYMEEKGLTRIDGTGRGAIELVATNRANITSKFSSYDPAVVSLLDAESAKMCKVEVIDKDVLEGLVKMGKISADRVKQYKTLKSGINFTVSHY